MFFYFLLGIALLTKRPLPAITAIVIGLIAVGLIINPSSIGRFYVSPLMFEFLAGFWFGHFYRSGVTIPPVASLLLIVVSLIWLIAIGPDFDPPDWKRIALWGAPAALLVIGSVLLDRVIRFPNLRVPHLLGDASYSIYLVQFIAVSPTAILWKRFLPMDSALSQILFILTGAVIISLVGILSFSFIEKPLMAALGQSGASKSRVVAANASSIQTSNP